MNENMEMRETKDSMNVILEPYGLCCGLDSDGWFIESAGGLWFRDVCSGMTEVQLRAWVASLPARIGGAS